MSLMPLHIRALYLSAHTVCAICTVGTHCVCRLCCWHTLCVLFVLCVPFDFASFGKHSVCHLYYTLCAVCTVCALWQCIFPHTLCALTQINPTSMWTFVRIHFLSNYIFWVPLNWHNRKNFSSLIHGSFTQNRHNLHADSSCDFLQIWHKNKRALLNQKSLIILLPKIEFFHLK